MKLHIRHSKPYKWEAARFGVRIYFYKNNCTIQFDVWRKITEVIIYKGKATK